MSSLNTVGYVLFAHLIYPYLDPHVVYSHVFLMAASVICVIYVCVFLTWSCFLVLVRVLLLMLTDLTFSRRPNEFEREFGHGSVRFASWKTTTDLLHLLWIDTVSTVSSLCLLSQPNLITPFRAVRRGCIGSGDDLWDSPCRFACNHSNAFVALRPRHETPRRVACPPYTPCSTDERGHGSVT